jgi:hypothetical protein
MEKTPKHLPIDSISHTVNIYRYKTIEANANTGEIPTTSKSFNLYLELLHPILGIPLSSIGKLPFIGKLPIEA